MNREQQPGSDGDTSVSAATLRANEPPPGVAARLAALRALYVPEPVAKARARLARERPANREPFETAVARRLLELRSLSHMTNYLHRAVPRGRPGGSDDSR